ncbi:MAG: methyltransferase domain-containing protein [Fibrobacteria bacterium]
MVNPRNPLDDPETTDRIHRSILARKPFLRTLYREYYLGFRSWLPPLGHKAVLIELGSGGGFLKEVMPHALTSDVMPLSGIDVRMSGAALPFRARSVDAIFLLDAFHHFPSVAGFLAEADRCLKVGGRVVMMEPANTIWGRFIYGNFHHEPFAPADGWGFTAAGPLSSANGALPWIVFARDRARFEREYPRLRLIRFRAHTPLRYLLSGGFSRPQLVPSFTIPFWALLERLLAPLARWTGMFYWIVLEKAGA